MFLVQLKEETLERQARPLEKKCFYLELAVYLHSQFSELCDFLIAL